MNDGMADSVHILGKVSGAPAGFLLSLWCGRGRRRLLGLQRPQRLGGFHRVGLVARRSGAEHRLGEALHGGVLQQQPGARFSKESLQGSPVTGTPARVTIWLQYSPPHLE